MKSSKRIENECEDVKEEEDIVGRREAVVVQVNSHVLFLVIPAISPRVGNGANRFGSVNVIVV